MTSKRQNPSDFLKQLIGKLKKIYRNIFWTLLKWNTNNKLKADQLLSSSTRASTIVAFSYVWTAT